jgi:hypothetical protein
VWNKTFKHIHAMITAMVAWINENHIMPVSNNLVDIFKDHSRVNIDENSSSLDILISCTMLRPPP